MSLAIPSTSGTENGMRHILWLVVVVLPSVNATGFGWLQTDAKEQH